MTSIAREIQRFLDQHAARSPRTAKTYGNGLKRFQEYLIERDVDLEGPVEQLTLGLARDFVTWLGKQTYRRGKNRPERPLSMRSRQNYIMAMSGLYRNLVMDGSIPVTYGDYMVMHESVTKATKFKDSPIEKKLPPDEVMEAIIEAVQSPPLALSNPDLKPRRRQRLRLIWLRDKAMVLALYSTGMRIGELLELRRGDLDYGDQGAWVTGKGERTRFVRFSNRAWQAVVAYLNERRDEALDGSLADRPVICRHDRASGDFRRLPMSAVAAERAITNLAREAGVLARFHLTPHSFRHYFATRFLRHTHDLALTQDVMGHASPQTTRIYAKTTKEQHIEAHESLFDGDDEGDMSQDG